MLQRLPVGPLWDSVSNNIGDKAIGLVTGAFGESRRIDYEVLGALSCDPARYSVILVAGGELLRNHGDPSFAEEHPRLVACNPLEPHTGLSGALAHG